MRLRVAPWLERRSPDGVNIRRSSVAQRREHFVEA
jgi:hypothetical protein